MGFCYHKKMVVTRAAKAAHDRKKTQQREKRVKPVLDMSRPVDVVAYCVRKSTRGERSTKKQVRRKMKDRCNKEFTKTDVRDIIRRYKKKHDL